jgi:hypothetical protein
MAGWKWMSLGMRSLSTQPACLPSSLACNASWLLQNLGKGMLQARQASSWGLLHHLLLTGTPESTGGGQCDKGTFKAPTTSQLKLGSQPADCLQSRASAGKAGQIKTGQRHTYLWLFCQGAFQFYTTTLICPSKSCAQQDGMCISWMY